MKDGTQNFYSGELHAMEERERSKADEIGKRPPYYFEYARKVAELNAKRNTSK